MRGKKYLIVLGRTTVNPLPIENYDMTCLDSTHTLRTIYGNQLCLQQFESSYFFTQLLIAIFRRNNLCSLREKYFCSLYTAPLQ